MDSKSRSISREIINLLKIYNNYSL